MAGLNKVELMGNLVAKAELRFTQSGRAVVSARIATNERYYAGGEQKDRTEYHNVVIWGNRGKGLHEKGCLEKGQGLYICGRNQTRSYTSQKDGVKRWVTEVVAGIADQDIQLLGSRRQGASDAEGPADELPPPPFDADAPVEATSESTPEASGGDFAE